MNDVLARVVEQLRQNRAARAAALETALAAAPRPAFGFGSTFPEGARVFDRVTGLEGEIIYVRRENLVVSASE